MIRSHNVFFFLDLFWPKNSLKLHGHSSFLPMSIIVMQTISGGESPECLLYTPTQQIVYSRNTIWFNAKPLQ